MVEVSNAARPSSFGKRQHVLSLCRVRTIRSLCYHTLTISICNLRHILKGVLSIKEMKAIHSLLYCKSEQMGVPKSNKCESSNYSNIEYTVFDVLQSLRRYVVISDIRLKADDDTIVIGHKSVLMHLLVNISGLCSLILVNTEKML